MKNNKDISVIKEKLKQELPFLSERFKVKSLGIFGSYIRQKQTKSSDLDLLIDFNEIPSLLKFIELENYLTDLLGIKVDLVMRNALKPRIGKRILKKVQNL